MVELDSERQKQAKEYAKKRRRLGFINFIFSTVLISVLIITSLSSIIARNLPGVPPISAALYLVILVAVYDILTLPLSYRTGYKLPTQYGLLHQTFSGWISDHFKSLAISAGFGAAIVAFLFLLMEHSPDAWWLVAWGLLTAVTLIITVLAPVLLVPLFYKMRPLEEGALKDRLLAIAKNTRVNVSGIYIIEFSEKTTMANAAVMGLGSTKRIVISDTLISAYTPEEIDVVMAHELGHQRHADVWRLFGVQTTVYFGVFWLAAWLFKTLIQQTDYVNSSNPAALPLLLLCVTLAAVPGLPILSWISRKLEAAADAFALDLSQKPDVFISAMTKLTNQNLGESRPSNILERLGQDHPSYADRVKMAQEFSTQLSPQMARLDKP